MRDLAPDVAHKMRCGQADEDFVNLQDRSPMFALGDCVQRNLQEASPSLSRAMTRLRQVGMKPLATFRRAA